MGKRGGGIAHRRWVYLPAVAAAVAVCCAPVARSAEGAKKPPERRWLAAARPVRVETVSFANPRQASVRVIRGAASVPHPAPEKQVEILSFGKGRGVKVVRGALPATAQIPHAASPGSGQLRVETVAFADPRKAPVTVVRGPPLGSIGGELFGPARPSELDRIAFAVDGIESRHGADPAMWRTEPDGPQGPMQVSLKAAVDVGGGDRFDLAQNRLLGRAYLAHLYRRYGNWADALAAYNWGPGNLDQWIADGRRPEALPFEVARYVERALRDALLTTAGGRF